jgi:hypothetical protein
MTRSKISLTLTASDMAAIAGEEPEIRRVQIAATEKRAFAALDSAAGLTDTDPPWLWRLRLERNPTARRNILDAVKVALQERNPQPFRDILRVLEQAEVSDLNIKEQIARVEWLLLDAWLARDGAPFELSLCYYSDRALAKLCSWWCGLNLEHWNVKSIRKVWERLGLRKASRLLFKDVEFHGKEVHSIPFKKLIQPARRSLSQ